jgi:hypothetical protein
MHFLISTSNSFLVWNHPDPYCFRVHEGCGTYYGISYTQTNVYVAARHLPLTSGDSEKGESKGTILIFDYQLNLIRQISPPFPLRDVHQILCLDNRLFVTMTYDDMIAIYDGVEWRDWRPVPPLPWGTRSSGGRHFNSILYFSGCLYLLAHNFGPSEVYVFDAGSLTLARTFSMGNHAHNLWFQGNQLLACSSYDHGIVSEWGGVAHTGNFPRGVVATAEGQYIGISMFVEDRARRGYPDCFIAHFRPGWHLKAGYRLIGEGPLGDVRCLGDLDGAHSHLVGPEPDLSNIRVRCPQIPIEKCPLPTIAL